MIPHIPIDGRHVHLNAPNPLHWGYQAPEVKRSFQEILTQNLMQRLEQVNSAGTHSESLIQTMVTRPNAVDVHDVMIATQKAQILLDLTKTVLQKSITGFQTITNLR